jgi:cysteine desulfurase/selenocysteine lyase
MLTHATRDHGNVHRGVHAQGEAATAAYEGARARVARFVGADPRCVVFTSGATAALNLAAAGWARGGRVLVSALEHHSSLLPWRAIARANGARIETLPLDPRHGVDPGTRLDGADVLVVTARSNVLGMAPPVAALCAGARRRGVLTVVDAAQALGPTPLDVRALGCDLLALSAHKAYGPTGVGALVIHPDRLAEGRPLLWGGGMVAAVDDGDERLRPPPWCFEAGTPPVAAAVGFGAAIGLLERLDPRASAEWVTTLTARLVDGLRARGDVRILADLDPDERGGIVSFTMDRVHPHDVAGILAEAGVAVQAGAHCAAPLLARLGVEATVRASLGPANTADDVAGLLAALHDVRRLFP